MTCENCIHYKACLRKERIVIDGINRAAQYASEFTNNKIKVGCNKRESICEHFADNSRFIELPCKVGDTVYFREYKRIGVDRIKSVRIDTEGQIFFTKFYRSFIPTALGKLVFLNYEEAEKALKEREKNG